MWNWAARFSPICSQPGSTATGRVLSLWRQPMNTTINEQQLSKTAYVYVRQSTLAQVRHHQESTERQYALKEKALQLGWNDSTVQILDRDLGKSGAQITGREDFKTLVAEVSMGQVGAVFALEVSRLARSNLDWHRLLELCALTDTLVIDEDGCYNPADFNDGLLLGLKGTMAQAELHLLRGRLLGGKLGYPPFTARLKPILFGELRKLLSAVNKTYFGFICQSYLVLMLASQIAWAHTRPVSISNDRYPKPFGPRVMLLLSGLLLRKDLVDLIAGVVVQEHTQFLHHPRK